MKQLSIKILFFVDWNIGYLWVMFLWKQSKLYTFKEIHCVLWIAKHITVQKEFATLTDWRSIHTLKQTFDFGQDGTPPHYTVFYLVCEWEISSKLNRMTRWVGSSPDPVLRSFNLNCDLWTVIFEAMLKHTITVEILKY